MSCYNKKCYLPEPPRLWSRVENSCALITNVDNSNGLVKLPYSGEIVPVSVLGEKLAMLNKGNVLQYKANSSNLTKAQRYSKIAKGKWVNRNTTWATQSTRGITNPNTTSLKRVGNPVNIAIDPITGTIIGPTNEPPTCPKPINPIYPVLPVNNGGGTINEPNIPPPINPTPGSDVFPDIQPETPIEPIIIQDGGILICSIQENICTGETRRTLSQQLCNPTSDSDVPGPIQDLCWNDGTPTWYPRQRYTMSNSTNKWPFTSGGRIDNVTFISAIRPLPPVITNYIFSNCGFTIELFWTQSEFCLPVEKFLIYQNDNLIKIVEGNVFSTEIILTGISTTSYYIISSNQQIISEPSNKIFVDNTTVLLPVTNLNYNTIANDTIQLTWEICNNIYSYNIYQDGVFLININGSSYNVTGLLNCFSYLFSVITVNNSSEESSPATIIAEVLWPNPPSNLSASLDIVNFEIVLTWNLPNPNCSPPTSYTLYYSTDNITFNSISGIISPPYNFSYSTFGTYYFYMTSVNSSGESLPSSTISINVEPFSISGGTYNITSSTSGTIITYNIVIYQNSSSSNLTFYLQPDSNVNFQLVGAGGGGGGTWSNFTLGGPYPGEIFSGAGGGGGGNILINNFTPSLNSAYTITIGTGGTGGSFGGYDGENIQATPGTNGGNTSLIGAGVNCYAEGGFGGQGGEYGGTRALGGAGGSYIFNQLINGNSYSGSGGTGGQGNSGGSGSYNTGTNGTNSYFYDNPSLTYSPSTDYVTYYKPSLYPYNVPNSITLINWYSFSGGGGGANSNSSSIFVAYPGGSGVGSGGLNGGNYTLPPYPPYPSYGGGGGGGSGGVGGGINWVGTGGGNGLAVIWFSYNLV
jgi:hypothetical protein